MTGGTDLRWADTVLGTFPPNARTGDLATLNSSAIGNAKVVIAKGCVFAGDGGGGVFFWEDGVTTGDNGGTIIVPSPAPTGRWRRIFSGALNVQWFGAIPNLGKNGGPSIQAAIDTAYQVQHHPEIYIPAGEYVTEQTILIPRGPSTNGFTFRGDGIAVTSLVGRNLAAISAVMAFNPVHYFDFYGFRLEGMLITRLDPGAVFAFNPSVNPVTQQSHVMYLAVVRNVRFMSPDPFGGPYNPYTPLLLQKVHDSVFENVQSEGGEKALLLLDSSRCTFTNFVVGPRSSYSQNGIVIVSSGGHIFNNTRIGPVGSPTYKGDGLILAPNAQGVGPKQCTFNLIQFEGRWTQNAITIQAGSELLFINVNAPGHGHGYNPPMKDKQRGIWIWAGVRHVRFIGGWCNNYTDYPYGSVAIEVANGAKDIRFDDVGISQPFTYGEVKFPDPLDPTIIFASERVQGTFTFGGSEPNITAGTLAVGIVEVLGLGPVASVKGHDVWRVSGDIHTLNDGYDGQRLTLLGETNALQVKVTSGTGNIRLSTSTFTLAGPTATLQLIYDRRSNLWLEVARSQNL